MSCDDCDEVLEAGASTMYLGKAPTFQDSDENELRHRLKRAWTKFGVYQNELTNKRYSLFDRMKLFNAVVTPSVLYGCGCWAMTQARMQKLRSTKRKMLRSILGKGRQLLTKPADSSDSTSDTTEDSTTTIEEEEVAESW